MTTKQRSKAMAAVKGSRNVSTEIAFVRFLKSEKIVGWRRGNKSILGKPDFVFPRKKVVVFVDGCFWHGCKKHGSIPKTNRIFWKKKIERNIDRDKKVRKLLRDSGWAVVRIWEHTLKSLRHKTVYKNLCRTVDVCIV